MNSDHLPVKMNIDELFKVDVETNKFREGIYTKILNRIHKRIKYVSKQKKNNKFCAYIIPEFILGYPRYDIYECTKFIMEKLDENGFKLKYTHPNMLWITWNHWIPMHDRANIKKNTGVNVDGLGNIIRKKKDKDMTNSLFLFNDNIKNVKNVKKNKTFKDVKTYKPTGKFIYNNSLIENTTI